MSYYDERDVGTYTFLIWLSGFLAAAFIASTITTVVFAWKHMSNELPAMILAMIFSLVLSIVTMVNGHTNVQVKK